ncbi:MAG TPA: hypothetical protein ENK02_01170 [Planctomycetes bacterium]|nr:hypothetical protein [Planctomycetota bacterium]
MIGDRPERLPPGMKKTKEMMDSLERGPVRLLWPRGGEAPPRACLEPGYVPSGERQPLGRGGAQRVELEPYGTVVWKTFRRGGGVRFLGGHYFRTTPLENEVEAHLRLAARGLAVPQLCFGRIERRAVGFQLELVTRFVPGRTLLGLLDEARPEPRRALAPLREMGWLVRRMHELGFVHGDLHPGNLLLPEQGPPLVLDLTSGSFEEGAGPEADPPTAGQKDLVRLARYWRKHRAEEPPLPWVLAFLQGYEARRQRRRALLGELKSAYERQVALRSWRW